MTERRNRTSSNGGVDDRAELREPAFEEAPLGIVVDQHQRPAIRIAGLFRSTEAAQQLAPSREQVAVVGEIQAIDDGEPRLGALGLGDRDVGESP